MSGYVYMLASKCNGTLYMGVTNCFTARVAAHREGVGSQFTRNYNIHMLVWYAFHEDITTAIRRETSLKRWKRVWKLALIETDNPHWIDLAETML